jgi:hypothetical protein
MINTHRNKLIGMPMSSPIINLRESVRLLSSVPVILVITSGSVCPFNLISVIVLMISISSFPGFGAKFGLQNLDTARNVPERFKESTLRLFNDNREMGGQLLDSVKMCTSAPTQRGFFAAHDVVNFA